MKTKYWPFMSLKYTKKCRAEGPPELSHDSYENKATIRHLWHELYDQAEAKIIVWWALVVMTIFAAVGWYL